MKEPEVVVGVFIQNKEGKILLVHSPKWKNYWTYPGGHVQYGETREEAVRREIKEELGAEVGKIALIRTGEQIESPDFERPAHLIYFYYLCEAFTEDFIVDGHEIESYKWFTIDEIINSDVKMAAETVKLITGKEFALVD